MTFNEQTYVSIYNHWPVYPKSLQYFMSMSMSPRAAMPETQPTRSSSSCLLAVSIQLCTATCCSGVFALRLVSKWEKEVARVCEPNGTDAPNRDKRTEWNRFFWWTLPPPVLSNSVVWALTMDTVHKICPLHPRYPKITWQHSFIQIIVAEWLQ